MFYIEQSKTQIIQKMMTIWVVQNMAALLCSLVSLSSISGEQTEGREIRSKQHSISINQTWEKISLVTNQLFLLLLNIKITLEFIRTRILKQEFLNS